MPHIPYLCITEYTDAEKVFDLSEVSQTRKEFGRSATYSEV